MISFAGRTAVITGAASGLGREFARYAAQQEMRLALADIDGLRLEQTASELRQAGADVFSERIDVAEDAQVAAFARSTAARFGTVHLLINNAGVASGGYVWENTDADWRWIIGVNVLGVVNGLRHFVPMMLQSEQREEPHPVRGDALHAVPGHIVNVASVAAWLAAPLMGVYNASKHAVAGLTETLWHDLRLANSRIGVTLLCPAYVPTGIAQSHRNRPRGLQDDAPATASQQVAQLATERAVAGGKTSAEEIACMTFDAVREGRFNVITHPQIVPSIRARFDAIVDHRLPADPFGQRPAARPTVPSP